MASVKESSAKETQSCEEIGLDESLYHSFNLLCAMQEEVEQLTFEKENLNKTIQSLESESNDSDQILQRKIDALTIENEKLRETHYDMTSIVEKYDFLLSKCESRDQELEELEKYNRRLEEKVVKLKKELKTKDEIIRMLRDFREDPDFVPKTITKQ